MALTLLAGYGKNPFLPLVQCCCNSSWSGLWAVFLQRTEMKPHSQSTGPECVLADMNFTCSGGHFAGYLLAALLQKERYIALWVFSATLQLACHICN